MSATCSNSRSEHFPGERLLVCRNPLLAEERARKRGELLAATEVELAKIAAATQRARRRCAASRRSRCAWGASSAASTWPSTSSWRSATTTFSWRRRDAAIAHEAALDGLYVIRTSVSAQQLGAAEAVAAYKSLAQVERAFRSMKTVDLQVRPVFHYSAPRVRAHVFLCMLAYYVEWHMRQRLKPMLFDDEYLEQASASRASPVLKAVRSEHAKAKDLHKTAADGTPLHSFRTLLARPRHAGLQRHPHRAQPRGQDHHHHAAHAAAAKGLRAARTEPGLYPVARPPPDQNLI